MGSQRSGTAARSWAGVLTLVPRWRLLVALTAGAGLVALTVVSAFLWPVAAVYHAVLGWALVRDARRLPAPARFLASREVPRPLSLGAEQAVLIGLSCPEAAGLRCAVADHVPADLGASPRATEAVFDDGGQVIVEYRVRPPRRGVYDLPAMDVRVWRPEGWWLRQFRLPLAEQTAVYPDVLAIRRW